MLSALSFRARSDMLIDHEDWGLIIIQATRLHHPLCFKFLEYLGRMVWLVRATLPQNWNFLIENFIGLILNDKCLPDILLCGILSSRVLGYRVYKAVWFWLAILSLELLLKWSGIILIRFDPGTRHLVTISMNRNLSEGKLFLNELPYLVGSFFLR